MRHRWGPHPRGRPPWWPADEPWPPASAPWRRQSMRRFFFLLPILFFALPIAFIAVIAALGAVVGPWPVLGAIVVLALLLFAGARRFAMPVGEVMDAVERVGQGDYEVRVRARGPRQIRALATSFNAMVERLASHEEQRRRLLADVTHELRGPLTVVQGELEALLDGIHPADAAHVEPILEETRVLARLIEDLRTLSLAEAGALTLHREPTDVIALARDTLASFQAQADRSGVRLALDADGAAVAEVDPVRAREVLTNLVANALRYTPSGGSVDVRVARDGERLAVTVRDTGSGISPEALPHVFDRFYKSPESRGAGLGLAIAKSLVAAHGGEIAAGSVASGGTEIRFTLPLAP